MTERVVLIGKPDCHLCDVARGVVEAVCAEAGLAFTEISIWDDPSTADLYGPRIPVVLIDGTEVAQFRVDAGHMRAALGVA